MYSTENTPAQNYEYSLTDTIFAWISLLFGFLFCKALPIKAHPSGAFILILALFASGFIFLKLKKAKINLSCILCTISAIVIGAALVLTDTLFLIKLSFAYSIATYCYVIYSALGNKVEEGFSDWVFVDYFKVLFLLPFCSLGSIFHALSNKATKKGSQFVINIITGIAIAIIPTIIVFLLLSYDDGFIKIIKDLFDFNFDNIANTILCLMWTVPLATYGFSLYTSSAQRKLRDKVSADTCGQLFKDLHVLPQVTAAVTVIPILFLYVVFFVSQWQYYISGFTGVLPETFSYAQYARQGFFELCAVSVINLVIIIAISTLIKRKKDGSPIVLKVVTTIFCLCTLILISTAVSKLVMYIEYYGLTPMRIYAMWLMILIGLAFLIIAIGQFVKKVKVVALCFSIAVVMFSGLAVCNVNALCAQYNVDMYLAGNLESLDVSAMQDLGDSAIPSLVRVAEAMDKEKDSNLSHSIDLILTSRAKDIKNKEFSIFRVSVPYLKAKAALADYMEE